MMFQHISTLIALGFFGPTLVSSFGIEGLSIDNIGDTFQNAGINSGGSGITFSTSGGGSFSFSNTFPANKPEDEEPEDAEPEPEPKKPEEAEPEPEPKKPEETEPKKPEEPEEAEPAPVPAPAPAPAGTTTKSVSGATIYLRKFTAAGFVDNVCLDQTLFCDSLEGNGTQALAACYAARIAGSKVQAAYSFEGTIRVQADLEGDIRAIDLNTESSAAALAVSFAASKSATKTRTTVNVNPLAVSSTGIAQAASIIEAETNSTAVSVAYAQSLGAAGTLSYTGTQVRVRGTSIKLFDGFITSAAGAFAFSNSTAESLSSSAASSFAEAYTAAIASTVDDNKEYAVAGEIESRDTLSAAYGKAVASAIGAVGIAFTFEAAVDARNGTGTVEILLGNGTGANVICSY